MSIWRPNFFKIIFFVCLFSGYYIVRTDDGQHRPKYIFNKCGTNIYFFTLQRFGPSPSPNFKTKTIVYSRLVTLNLSRSDFTSVYSEQFSFYNQECEKQFCHTKENAAKKCLIRICLVLLRLLRLIVLLSSLLFLLIKEGIE